MHRLVRPIPGTHHREISDYFRSNTVLAVTGTDEQPISQRFALHLPYGEDETGPLESAQDVATGSNAPANKMSLSLRNTDSDAAVRSESVAVVEEAPPGFEPGMKVLQTSALPLGYGARKK